MRKLVAFVVFVVSIPAFASSELATLDKSFGERLRGAGDRVTIEHLVLPGLASPVNIHLERFEVWAPDAKIIAHGDNGSEQILPIPATRYFRGTIEGQSDAFFFAAVEPDGSINAMGTAGLKRFSIASGRRIPAKGQREVREPGEDAPVFVRETDAVDEMIDGVKGWTCAAEKIPANTIAQIESMSAADARARVEQSGSPGPSANVSYNFRIAVETDYELFVGFGSSTSALSTYIGNLVGASSTIYQRDVKATLTLGTLSLWTTPADPFSVGPPNTSSALNEFGSYWHTNHPMATDQHAAVAMVSGKNFSGGVAWLNRLSGSDTVCAGGNCGQGNDGLVIGPYAFVGSISTITTTVPNPNAIVGGHLYGVPVSNSFWILSAFAHELGHVCSSPHTHCMTLTAQEKTTYNTTRNFVDECYAGEGSPCFASTTSNYRGSCYTNNLGQPTYYCPAPVEWGTIMSYCHNTSDPSSPNNIPSRYTFGLSGEPSFKVLNYFSTRFEAVTPNVILTAPAAPIACGAQNASVPSANGVTYQWQITGGTINGSSTSNAVNFTPNSTSVTLTITATNLSVGAAITNSVTLATNCGACQAAPAITSQPSNLTITQGSPATLSVTAAGTTLYSWYQLTNNGSVPVGTNSSTLTVSPSSTAQYFVWVYNACGGTISNLATVTVNPNCQPVSYAAQPLNTTITQGQSAQLSVVANGTGPFTYAWYQLTNAGSVPMGTNSSVLTVSPLTTSQYFVWTYNACGQMISNLVTVTVNPACSKPSITSQPANTTITQGQNAQLSVTATGGAPYAYYWYQLTNAGSVPVGTNSSTLSIAPSTTSQYFVWVYNACGGTISNLVTVTVNPACTTPSITSQPANTAITQGQTAQFSVTPSGGAPYAYYWYQLTNSGSVPVGTSSSTLSVSPSSTSQYFVWVYNACGGVISNLVTVTVNAACSTPSIASQPANTTITQGQSAQLSVTASGGAPYAYFWYQVTNSGSVAVGTNSPTLTVSPSTTTQYFVWVYNACGSVGSNSAFVTVH